MNKFKLVSEYKPTGDQPVAIAELVKNIKDKKKFQVLLGATGTGKTFTVANVIEQTQKKTLIMAHNKTLAAQLYSELKVLFPTNRVEYFVSNFDFYQPEAYLPKSDMYIDKTAQANSEIEMLRMSALNSLVSQDDVIVVASVAAIYGEFDPTEFKKLYFRLEVGQRYPREELLRKLVASAYQRNEMDLKPGCFRTKGDVIEISPGWSNDYIIRISLDGNVIEEIAHVDVLNNNVIKRLKDLSMGPADDYITSPERMQESIKRIREELEVRIKYFKEKNLLLECQRIEQRTKHDLETLTEFGMCSGIENYSRHLELREKGEPPFTLIDYFDKDWLLIMDECHISLPQIRGMFHTDLSRKQTLVDYGFRLPSAMDNRPLSFEEYFKKIDQAIFVSATPAEFELDLVKNKPVEQIIRPTGLVDPTVEIKPSEGQIDDIIANIKERIKKKERSLVTTLTIRMAEDLTAYLKDNGLRVAYLHAELKTLERTKVINELRKGVYDVLVGINLLKEGIDIPEVSFIGVLDADKEGFLRNARSLIQIIGRAARNLHGHVILYADKMTDSIKAALKETDRRRNIQLQHNIKYNITPKTIIKPIREISNEIVEREINAYIKKNGKIPQKSKHKLIDDLRAQMMQAAGKQDYEKAAQLRDIVLELEAE